MDDIYTLKALQVDALREVANIGAGHAATALSQMVGGPIMISVPTANVARIEDIPPQVSPDDEPVAAVLSRKSGRPVKITRLEHRQPSPLEFREGMRIDDERLYRDLPETTAELISPGVTP